MPSAEEVFVHGHRVVLPLCPALKLTRYDRTVLSEADESGISLVSTRLEEQFTGGLVGRGVAGHLRITHPDGSDTFTGIERITGRLGDRSGSFAVTASGHTRDGVVRGTTQVVPGSATGELAGLAGCGVFIAVPHQGATGGYKATDAFTHWFEPDPLRRPRQSIGDPHR
jgi:Protein of unknown function (DUF3224)